jgi:hypothetical protein
VPRPDQPNVFVIQTIHFCPKAAPVERLFRGSSFAGRDGKAIKLIDLGAFSGMENFYYIQTPLEISVLWPIPTLAWERLAVVWRTVDLAL